MSKYLLLIIGVVSIYACNKKVPETLVTYDAMYELEIDKARKEREKNLKKPQGWLSLVGLYWLEEGVNTIGAAEDNNIIFPGTDTETIGAYQLTSDEVFFGKVEGVEVNNNKGQQYLGGPVDVSYPPSIANHGSLYWYVMKRGERYAIRLKDTLAENRLKFSGIKYFPLDPKYQVTATVVQGNDATVPITNVLGNTVDYKVDAFLDFELEGKPYRLAALDEGGDSFFVIFGDKTNGVSSYGGGRFLYPLKPAEGADQISLDFNLAQNPPCAYTDFATCPLPPTQNLLDIAITKGERYNSSHR